jgi:cysteine desulfurase
MIYFDSAGSYKMLDEVVETIHEVSVSMFANPSSSHTLGEMQAKKIEEARDTIADIIGCYSSEIIFTSGATESNNLALKQILNLEEKAHIITSATEHKCILSILNYIQKQGHEVTIIKPNPDGIIKLDSIKNALEANTKLVSIMHVNNELGVINPISEIGQLCFEHGILFHTDAAQSFGKLEIDVDDMNIDMMSISAHKIGGPKGIGALYVRDLRKKELLPVIHGAGQEYGVRGGTLPTP